MIKRCASCCKLPYLGILKFWNENDTVFGDESELKGKLELQKSCDFSEILDLMQQLLPSQSMELAAWPMCIVCNACRPLMVDFAQRTL